MIIEEQDFRLISIDDSSNCFDLELLYTVNKGKPKERTEFRNSGYGLPFHRALEKIIINRIGKKQNVYDLKTFLQEYKSEVDSIKKLCQIEVN